MIEEGMATHEPSDLTEEDYVAIAREKLGMAPARGPTLVTRRVTRWDRIRARLGLPAR